MESKGPIKDYLKYYRIVRYWAKAKYGIKQDDMEMLFFLYSEHLFDITLFREYEKTLGWDNKRMKRLIEDGWIKPQTQFSRVRAKRIYRLSKKSKNMIKKIYNILDGSEKLETDPKKNPLFRPKARYIDRQVGKEILKLNRSLKGN